MSHLSEEQLESILLGEMPEPPHVAACAACRRRLAERRALRDRLRVAFDGVRPEAALADRVRRQLADAARRHKGPDDAAARPPVRLRRIVWPIVTLAAVLLVVAVPLGVLLLGPGEAIAAQEEFARLHRRHEAPGATLFTESDPSRLAAYLKRKLDFDPAVLRPGADDTFRGCCVDRFRGRPAAAYVLDTPGGMVSLVVMTATPEELKLRHSKDVDGRTVWFCAHKRCKMAGVRAGTLSYYVVGEVPHDALIDLLLRVVPRSAD